MIEILFTIAGTCFLFGVVYPVCAILIYPVYKMLGGKKKLREYIRGL